MLKIFLNTTLSISLLLSSSLANASLITNGSFEELLFADNSLSKGNVHKTNLQNFGNKNSAWDVFYTLPGWITTAGNGIELQKNIVTDSADGQQHVELDSHPRGSSNAVMTQSLDSLIIGAEYLLEFSYKPRTNQLNDNGINVFWYDAATDFNLNMNADLAVDGRSKKHPSWATQSIVLTAQSETMDLSFGAFGKQNSLGGLLDNVSLVQVSDGPVTDIPEPSIFALSLFGFAALIRRQQKIKIKSNAALLIDSK
ncbi:hypothetical protein CXF85_20070 [Colwellia sp. 75C3]|uniref:DUF642 domain-containing protein n=1 Tax=Colwellia sp. 75C3 TaxID=888425 RepID=UPI000C34E698|nr:DUF642 domain-containing protein [Colwellia sp. 75C3]PKG81060.1 hypothetical protein CXF85_20070 [Colwellia sp. 75C3]